MASQLISLAFLSHLLTLVAAAPLQAQKVDAWQYGTGGGIIGFIVFILDVIAIVEVIQSTRPVSHKLLWSLLIFLFPIGGILIYFLFSDRQAHKRGYEAIP